MNGKQLQRCFVVLIAFAGLSVGTALGAVKKSPIKFEDAHLQFMQNLPGFEFTYPAVDAKVRDRGGHHTGADVLPRNWEPPPPQANDIAFAGPKLVHDGKTYGLHGFHFHLASEHWLNETRYDMELHLVHRDVADYNNILVVGRWITKDATEIHPEINKVFNPLPGPAVGPKFDDFNINFDLATLLPPEDSRKTYRYTGSLTAEGDQGIEAHWRFFNTPLKIHNDQYTKFKDYLTRRGLTGNAMDPQGIDARTILTDVPEPSVVLLLPAVIGLAALRRKRR